MTARSWRVYGMLRYRYVEGLSQEATAEKLAITARHLRRSYAEAIHALGLALWEKQAGPGYTLPAPLPRLCPGHRAHPPTAGAGTSSWCASWKRWRTPMPAPSPNWSISLRASPAWRRT